MKRLLNILVIALICAALSSPSAEAQGRNGHGSQQTSQRRNAPASGSQSDRGNRNNSSHGSATRAERPAAGNHQQAKPAASKQPQQPAASAVSGSSLRPAHASEIQKTNATKAPAASNNRPKPDSGTRPGNGGLGNSSHNPPAGTTTRPGNSGNSNQGNNGSAVRPGNNGNSNQGNNGSAVRPGNSGNSNQGNNGSAVRPGNNGNNHPNGGGSNRPGNNGNNGNHRPGNDATPPGGNNFHPGNGGNHGHPNHNGKPGTPPPPPPAYGYGPGGDRWHGNFHDIPHHAPHRPMLPPPPSHFFRPTPPPAFRPTPMAPRFSTILGIALGSAINYTLNQLFSSGYYVTGYTSNAVYLSDVLMLNQVWPNVTLQYNKGLLTGSEFVYPSAYYNTDIYYNVYNKLQASYGIPVAMNYLTGGGMQATWFGYDGRYVNLTFQSGTAIDGQLRYYTTLSFGN